MSGCIKFRWTFFLLIVTFAAAIASSSQRPRLRILIIYPATGTGTLKLVNWIATFGVLTQLVNNRSDILDGYQVEIEYGDEQRAGLNAPTALMQFALKMQHQNEKSLVPSPIVVGASNSNGCRGMGYVLHYINYVAISGTCTAAYLVDRSRFRNLYLTMPIANPKNYGYIRFLKEIGKWHRIALLTWALNSNDFNAALHFHRIATTQGVKFSWFTTLIAMDKENALSLKKSDSRVIVLMSSSRTVAVSFYCQIFMAGISGDRYLFLIYDNAFFDPNSTPASALPEGCSRDILLQQIRQTFWMVDLDGMSDLLQKSSLGHNRYEFDEMLFRYKGTREPEGDFSWRLPAHDVYMHAILALNETENRLKAENLSLQNFYSNPEKVSKIANQSVFDIDYRGIRAPRVRYDKETGQLSGLPGFISYWQPGNSFRKVVRINQHENYTNPNNYDAYYLELLEEKMLWPAGSPPRDSRQIKIEIEAMPDTAFYMIVTICGVLSCVQILGILAVWRKQGDISVAKAMPKVKCLALVGCLALNAAGIAFVIQSSDELTKWYLRFGFLIVGLAVLNGSIAMRVVFNFVALKKHMATITVNFPRSPRPYRTQAATMFTVGRNQQASAQSWGTADQIAKEVYLAADVKCVKGISLLVVLHLIALAAWYLSDNVTCPMVKAKPDFYDERTDVETWTYSAACTSPHQLIVVCCICAAHMVLLAAVSLVAFKQKQSKQRHAFPELLWASVALANALTILVASTFIVLAFTRITTLHLVISVVAVTLSASTTFLLLLPNVSAYNRRQNYAS